MSGLQFRDSNPTTYNLNRYAKGQKCPVTGDVLAIPLIMLVSHAMPESAGHSTMPKLRLTALRAAARHRFAKWSTRLLRIMVPFI
jgi:hypothetical protein